MGSTAAGCATAPRAGRGPSATCPRATACLPTAGARAVVPQASVSVAAAGRARHATKVTLCFLNLHKCFLY